MQGAHISKHVKAEYSDKIHGFLLELFLCMNTILLFTSAVCIYGIGSVI